MELRDLSKITDDFPLTEAMPVLFIGHGSPMNAIEQNEFSIGWGNAVRNMPLPKVVLCISAHWETKGTQVTSMEKPRTIHDFGGFPQSLFDVQYPAPGSPLMAAEIKKSVSLTEIVLDDKWGLDHGCWSILKHMYPKANVPVIQLSLDYYLSPAGHYSLAQQLSTLRKKGVLVIGSGNMVHNLGLISWQQPDKEFDWALDARDTLKKYILENNTEELLSYKSQGKSFDLAIPTPEHFLPLIYSLAMKEKTEHISFFNDKLLMGSIAMTSLIIS